MDNLYVHSSIDVMKRMNNVLVALISWESPYLDNNYFPNILTIM